jgi:hypothetical protein
MPGESISSIGGAITIKIRTTSNQMVESIVCYSVPVIEYYLQISI